MRKSLLALGVVAAVSAVPAQAEYLYGFGSMYLDYQKWDHGFGNDDSNFGQEISERNQAVIGIEGGAVFDWGQIYGFYDYEGVDRAGDNRGASLKGTIHYNLTDSGISLYAQVYNTDKDKGPTLHEQNRVLGLGYTGLKGDGWGFTPFIGFHQVNTEANSEGVAISGSNGGMFGYVGYYNTDIAGQNFTFSTWNELEFARNDEYAAVQSTDFASGVGSESWGLNGSLNAMWNVTDHISTGVLYRYTVNKLARKDYQDILIYRVQYNF
ncbi:outer membrane protein OmpK [Vibrio fluminensis]|uniref:outer membrane protein OmpK n=1 Tax=Vibrio fluminensis TaxID=2783614 RepID=UPI00188893D0|nr:outer membrane protein OmpK [Vibrio fluminensis]